MKKISGMCLVILLNLIISSAQAQSAEQCLRSVVEPRGQGLSLRSMKNLSSSDSRSIKVIALTSECYALGFKEAQVVEVGGYLEYLNLSSGSSEGVIIRQLDPKMQLGIYSRLSYQSVVSTEFLISLSNKNYYFVYQISQMNRMFTESIKWGVSPIAGDIHAN